VHAREVYRDDWSSAAVVLSDADSLRTFVYARTGTEDGHPDLAFGFEARAAELRRYFRDALQHGPLLPTTLIGQIPNDSVLFVRVSTTAGTEVMRTETQMPDPYSTWVSFPMGLRLGTLVARVALHPGMEEALVIGGMPRSRLPLTLLLATLTALFLVVTMVSWRRERELARLRTEFVSNVSHELRTPLAQIRMFAETLVLERVRSAGERHRALAIIDKEARRLTALVDNVLHFSRAERRAIEVSPEPTRLDQILSDVVTSFAPLAASHDVRIETDLPPLTAIVDAGAVQQCVLNLLDNAVKYGPDGQTIRLKLSDTVDETVILVEDQGPGIPERAREAIWDRFYRLRRDCESATAGTGIGLAVVRDLTALQGGRCWVESGQTGARFAIALPRNGSDHSRRESGEPNRHAG
jgi:signal transduction histidine kinase